MSKCTDCQCSEDEQAFCHALAICRDFYLGREATPAEVVRYVVFASADGIIALAEQAREQMADTEGMTKQ